MWLALLAKPCDTDKLVIACYVFRLMRAYVNRKLHFNEFFVSKKILLNECSCAAKLNYNTYKKSYSSA